MSGLFDKTAKALQASIQMRQLRNNVISANIANAETPGYKSKKIDFEQALSKAIKDDGRNQLQKANDAHFLKGHGTLDNLKPDIYDNPAVNVSNDGNSVDLEKEMAGLAENSVLHRAAVQLINKKLALMKYAAADGGQ